MRLFISHLVILPFLMLGTASAVLAQAAPLEALPVPPTGSSAPGSPALPAIRSAAESVTLLDPDDPASHPRVPGDRAAPEALPDAYLVHNDGVLEVTASEGLLKNDVDPDGDALYITAITAPSYGTLNIATDGSFTYTPNGGFEGTETLTYYLSDGGSTGTGIMTIEILPAANRGPIPVADTYAMQAGETLDVPAASGLLTNDVDLDGDSIHVTAITAPANGSINLAADGSFSYTPDAGFVGSEVMNYYISDGGQLGQDTGQVSIQVLPSGNRAPIGREDYWYTPTDTPLSIGGTTNIMHNDLDPDGDTFVVSAYYPATNGNLSVYSNGSFTYTPDAGFEGEDSFRYSLYDGNGMSSAAFTTVALLVGVYGDLPSGVLTPPEAMSFRLQSAVPNPFNPSTELSFNIDREGPVALRLFSLKGEVVATLVDEVLPAGPHTTVWNGRDAAGRQLASGTYFAELRHGGQRAVQKLTLVK